MESQMMFHGGFGFGWLIAAVIMVVPFWKISQRAGYTPWLSLLILVPLANIAFLYFLAFSTWPAQRTGSMPPQD